MQSTAFVSGADRGLGFSICAGLLQQGWQVLAGQFMPDWPELTALNDRYPDMLSILPLDVSSIESARIAAQQVSVRVKQVDLLINNAGVNTPTKDRLISEPQDYAEIHRMYNINAVGPLRVVEAFLPLVARSRLKRLCFVSSEAGSIESCLRVAWYGYTMSKAALNRAVKVMFNHLRPEGFTFRLFHPGWVQSYIGGSLNTEAELTPAASAAAAISFFTEPLTNEDHLALVDWQGETWPW